MIDSFSKKPYVLNNLTGKKSVHCNCFINNKIIFKNHSALIKTFHSQFYKYGGSPHPSDLLHDWKYVIL